MPDKTTVHHVTKEDYDPNNPDHVYIGRDWPSKRLKDAGWGNPHKVKPGGLNHDQAVALYQADLLNDPALIERAKRELAGKRLYCWCRVNSKGPRCHGEVLAAIANNPDDPFEEAGSA